jgi:hypothetical protein
MLRIRVRRHCNSDWSDGMLDQRPCEGKSCNGASSLPLLAAAAWPFGARAQQPPCPVIGFISSRASDESAPDIAGFRQGLDVA